VRTTTTDGRRGDADIVEGLKEVIQSLQKLLADSCALLELRIEKLTDAQSEAKDSAEEKAYDDVINNAKRRLQQTLDVRTKALAAGLGEQPLFDREAAKDEILRRLARLAS